MANHALAALESALRARKLDRTLTTALPPLERSDPSALHAHGCRRLDACLRGGLPRGQLSELAGPRSSGRTTLLLQLMAAATRRGEIAALVDTCDRLDVAIGGGRRHRSRSAAVDSRRVVRAAPVRTDRSRRRSRAQGAQPRAAGRRLRRGGHRSGRCAARGAPAACRSRRGCACSASSKAATPRACCVRRSRWRAAPAGSR